MGYVVVMFDAGGWHAVGVYPDWPAALIAHGAAINALRVVDHPHAEGVKIIPDGEDYAHAPLAGPVECIGDKPAFVVYPAGLGGGRGRERMAPAQRETKGRSYASRGLWA